MQLYYLYATIDPVAAIALNHTGIVAPAATVIFGVKVVGATGVVTDPNLIASTTVACVATNPL